MSDRENGAWHRSFIGYLGLGANLGDRRAALQAAVDALARRGVEILAASSVYETEPVGEVLDQPEFLNACLRIRTELDPDGLLRVCKEVESELGREAVVRRHGPRPIDVDVLALGDLVHRSELVTVPHPEASARRFVLVALIELDPDLSIPGQGRVADALAALGRGQAVRRHSGPLAVRPARG